MLHFLNENSGAIQAVTVVILLFVTWWYAYTTMKMSSVMQNQFNQSTQPFLSISSGIDRRVKDNDLKSIQLIFSLKNVGQVPLVYSNAEIEIKGVSINPGTVSLVLFPDQTTSIYSNLVSIPTLNDLGQEEQGKIKIIFCSSLNPDKKYYFERYFRLSKSDTFIDKENYGELKND